jgi:hypothetical protein
LHFASYFSLKFFVITEFRVLVGVAAAGRRGALLVQALVAPNAGYRLVQPQNGQNRKQPFEQHQATVLSGEK